MQIIIADTRRSKVRSVQMSRLRLTLLALGLSLCLMLLSAVLYHWIILTGARAGWPVVNTLLRVVTKDDAAQSDRFMRENIDAMAKRVGEMQAKILQLESLGERVSKLAGVNPADIKSTPGQGGIFVAGHDLTMEELQAALLDLDQVANQRTDLMTVVESLLFEQKIKKWRLPTELPVKNGNVGSSFGWRDRKSVV